MSVPWRYSIPVLLLLSGCTLIDQRTFNPNAGVAPIVPPPAAPLVDAPTDPRALFTLRPPATLDAAAQRTLARVVRAALARKPTATFAVVAVAPAPGDGSGQAETVLRAVIAAGVALGQASLRAQSGSPAEIRLYAE